MKLIIEIPDYDKNGLDVIWERKSTYSLDVKENSVVLTANKNGLISLGKQMLYMAYNDLPEGSHIHYDNFFTGKDSLDVELVIEKM